MGFFFVLLLLPIAVVDLIVKVPATHGPTERVARHGPPETRSPQSTRQLDDSHTGQSEINPSRRRHGTGDTPGSLLTSSRACNTSHAFPCACHKAGHDIVVNCSHRQLNAVPKNMPQKVTNFSLSHNNISVIPRGTFCRLVLLKHLDLSNNRLSQLTSGTFVGLYRLSTLLLNDNPLNMSPVTFPPHVFAPLSNLTYLNLKTIEITSIQSNKDPSSQYPDVALSPLRSLKTLLISGLSNRTFGEGVHKLTSLETLDLSGTTSFASLPKDVFVNFKNISIKMLNLSYCNLTWIHKEAFCNLPNIDTIDYSYNKYLEIKGVGISTYGLQNSTIRRLVLYRVHGRPSLTVVNREDVQYLTNTRLEEIRFGNNSIGHFGEGTINSLPLSLKVFTATWNDIQSYPGQVVKLLRLINIEMFDVSDQEWYRITTSDRNTMETERLSSAHTFGSTRRSGPSVLQLQIPPKLTIVRCSRTYKMNCAIPPLEFLNASVKYLYFSRNLLYRWDGPIKGAESVIYLDLSGNNCYYVSETFFAYATGLRTLRIGQNPLGKNLGEKTFYNLTSLDILDVHGVQLEYLSPNLFSRLTNLAHLNLSHNYLTSWNAYISGLVKLKTLDLTNNTFQSLPASLCQDLDVIQRHSNLSIDIQGNPLVCECNTEYFVRWLTTTQVTIRNLDAVTCKLENGTTLSLSAKEAILAHLQQHCRSYTILISGVCACLGLFLIISLVGVIHRHRWKLRYLCHVASNWRKRTGYQSLDSAEENPFGFDAFVSYEDSDRTFIREQIIPRLEDEAGLKLCIDKRDFVAGLYVTDNILHAIQNSRKTVVLLSRQFLKSKWCMYEFNMARMEGIHTGRQVLVVVLTEEIPTGQLSAEVIDVIHNQTYIEMTNNRYGEALFWDRLLSAIKSP